MYSGQRGWLLPQAAPLFSGAVRCDCAGSARAPPFSVLVLLLMRRRCKSSATCSRIQPISHAPHRTGL